MRIAHHRAGAVIDLGLFTRRGLDHRASFRRLAALELADEALDALIAGSETAGVHQVLPDRLGVAAPQESQFDRIPVGRAGAGRRTTTGLRFRRRGCASRQRRAKVGDHPIGRFCGGRVGTDRIGRFWRRRVGDHLVGRFCRRRAPSPPTGQPHWDSGGSEISRYGFAADLRGSLNASQRPSQPP